MPQITIVLLLSALPLSWSFAIQFPVSCVSQSRTSTICLATADVSLTSSNLYDGDFAGLSATFSSRDGTLIKVPEHLVPDSMLEWGTAPSALEVVVSEIITTTTRTTTNAATTDATTDTTTVVSILTRQTVQIMPAVGCAVDNLDTMKKEEILEIRALRMTDDGSTVSFDVPGSDGNTKTETTFATADKNRLRVVVNVEYKVGTGFALQTPIIVALERQISTESSKGTLADGGGLTGSKVTVLMGNLIKAPLFCDLKPLEWQPPGVKVLNLPGNLTIATSIEGTQNPWMLDIVYVNINQQGEGEKQVVRRSYHAP